MDNITPTEMAPADYLAKRVEDQISWYDKKSSRQKKWHYLCQTIVIVSGALIPILIGYSEIWDKFKYMAGILGVVIVVTEGISNLKKFKDSWLSYRMTAESLLREKILFQNQVGEFQGEPYDFKVFVLKCEQIMSGENANWVKTWEKKEQKEGKEAK